LPPLPQDTLCEALRHKGPNFLRDEGALATDFAHRIRQWRHSGFFAHSRIRSKAANAEGRQRLVRYMIHRPYLVTQTTWY
jgi:hypothetical protein